jgi:hypothetical protein
VKDAFQIMSSNMKRLPPAFVRELQDEHNVNLNGCGEGDEYLDADEPSEIELAMREVSLEELMCQPC